MGLMDALARSIGRLNNLSHVVCLAKPDLLVGFCFFWQDWLVGDIGKVGSLAFCSWFLFPCLVKRGYPSAELQKQ